MKTPFPPVCILILTLSLALNGKTEVLLNEIMASNNSTIADEDGDYKDWIELTNAGDQDADLGECGLSDDPSKPFKWIFPNGTTIEAGESLLVWASGKNRTDSAAALHSNFSISSSGESILLTAPDDTLMDVIAPVVLRSDISYGRRPEQLQQFAFFDEATPREPNFSVAYEGILTAPKFSTEGGFYTAPVKVRISAPDGATIYYSLDGSDPRPDRVEGELYNYKYTYPRYPGDPFGELLQRKMKSHVYTAPLPINNRTTEPNQLALINTWCEPTPRLPAGNLVKATVLRARAFLDGYLPSEAISHTYFVDPDIASRYSLPVISITTDEANLFDYDKGIYVPGRIADNWRTLYPDSQAKRYQIPGNHSQRGENWERPIHLEMFRPDGTRAFAQNLGARIHGSASRDIYFKSLRLYSRTEYDTRKEIKHPIFDGLEKQGAPGVTADKFSTFLLRNSGNDARGLVFRDALIQELIRHLPLETQAYQPSLHYINGESWGIINIRERIDEHYVSMHFEIDPDEVVILSTIGAVESGFPTDASHYSNMRIFASSNDLSSETAYEQMKQWMDVDNFALYYAFQIYIDNGDWPANNLKMWRRRLAEFAPEATPGHDGRWRWLVYDTDFGFNNASSNTLNRVSTPAGGVVKHSISKTIGEFRISESIRQSFGAPPEYRIFARKSERHDGSISRKARFCERRALSSLGSKRAIIQYFAGAGSAVQGFRP